MELVSGDDCFNKLDSKELLVYQFSAEWCPACQQAAPMVEEISKSLDKSKIKLFKVELTDESTREFVEKCEIKNIPTFMLFKNRTVIDKVIGLDKDKLVKLINENINKENINKNFFEQPKQEPKQEPKQGGKKEVKDFYPNESFKGEFKGFEYKKGEKGLGYYRVGSGSGSGSGGSGGDDGDNVEIHMVYGEWCGHSRNAKPAFEDLVKNKDIKTSKGLPVTFIMTEDTSPGMEQFKGKVRGFPTYMTVTKKGDKVLKMEELNGHNRSKDSIIEVVQKL